MGTPSEFNQILKNELNICAAWIPITNTFKIGDYGLVSGGVIVKGGNIRDDFGIDFQAAPGKTSSINFTSVGTTLVRSVNGANVEVFGANNGVDAKLTVNFSKENSFLLKAVLSSYEMQDLFNVARKLAEVSGWKRKYRVVSAVYSTKDCAIISSKSSNSSIELSGSADALKQFDLGAVAVGIEASRKQDIGLDIVGERGVIGLALFKLPMLWGNDPKLLSQDDTKVETSFDSNWPKLLPDDV